jgi:hypothetical protein
MQNCWRLAPFGILSVWPARVLRAPPLKGSYRRPSLRIHRQKAGVEGSMQVSRHSRMSHFDPMQPPAAFPLNDRCTSELDLRSTRRESQRRRQRSFAGGNHRTGTDRGWMTASDALELALPTLCGQWTHRKDRRKVVIEDRLVPSHGLRGDLHEATFKARPVRELNAPTPARISNINTRKRHRSPQSSTRKPRTAPGRPGYRARARSL